MKDMTSQRLNQVGIAKISQSVRSEPRATKVFFKSNRKRLVIATVAVATVGLGAFSYGEARIRSTFESVRDNLIADKSQAESRADSLSYLATDIQTRLDEQRARVGTLEGENRDYSKGLERERRRVKTLADSVEAQRRSIGMGSETARREALEYAFSLFPEGPKRVEYVRTQTSTYLRFRPNPEGTNLLNVPLTDRVLETVQTRDINLRSQEIELAKLGVRTDHINAYRHGRAEVVLVNDPLTRDKYRVEVRTLEGKTIESYPSPKK